VTTPTTNAPSAARINKTGIAAMAHWTIKTTMDPNGMLMSTTLTRGIVSGARGTAARGVIPGDGGAGAAFPDNKSRWQCEQTVS
jgi:hypothetical protein